MDVNIKNEDQILMSLVHYFVTQENYSPIFVQGVKDEIWLEKLNGPYRIVRINNNYIHNSEQFKFDQFKIRNILKQIKKKTCSFKVNALNINLNEAEKIDMPSVKNVDTISIHSLNEFETNKDILSIFPSIQNNLNKDLNGLDLILNVTEDINKKTATENKKFEKIFADKKVIITYVIMGICTLLYLIGMVLSASTDININVLALMGATNKGLLLEGQFYRLITYAFLHANLIHILSNMYCLYIIGPQIESKFGKIRFISIYILSAILGALLSASFYPNVVGVGASGAIFGLLGAMLYFGMQYRLYLKDSLVKRVLPVILLNLAIGFMVPGIDNACHIGGLIGGFLTTMALGIPENDNKKDTINGTILLLIFTIFVSYLAFFR